MFLNCRILTLGLDYPTSGSYGAEKRLHEERVYIERKKTHAEKKLAGEGTTRRGDYMGKRLWEGDYIE